MIPHGNCSNIVQMGSHARIIRAAISRLLKKGVLGINRRSSLALAGASQMFALLLLFCLMPCNRP